MLLLVREVRLNERQSNFVSAVTHELKTPVASLKLYLDTLQLRDLPESRREDSTAPCARTSTACTPPSTTC